MFVIIGAIVVIGSVLGGFTMSGGEVGALIHPSELVTIGGASMGAMIMMSPLPVIIALIKGVIGALKGSPFSKQMYLQLFKLLYELGLIARKQGLLAWEPHISNPHESQVFNRYPMIAKNHHVTEFICGLLTPVMDGSIRGPMLVELAESELKAIEDAHHAPLGVLQKTADALPGFGIVAAVLGIVITMGAINGPVEEIGHKVGTALVGTFLGILLSYGFFAPLATKMEFDGAAEMVFFRAIVTVVRGMAEALPPKSTIEMARRGLSHDLRPTDQEIQNLFKEVESVEQSS